MLAEPDDTELGRWILQSDALKMNDDRRNLLKQLHMANNELHQAASNSARHKLAGNLAEVANINEQLVSASKQIMVVLRELGKDN